MLRGVEAAPRLGAGRPATRLDVQRLFEKMQALGDMDPKAREGIRAKLLVAAAPAGKVVVYRGERSDAAYFILKGSVGVGYLKEDEYVILNYLQPGELFGEVAALTGAARTATVIAEEDSELLVIPARVLRQLAAQFERLRQELFTIMAQRLSQIEVPLGSRLDQESLRDLRTTATP